MSALQKNIIRVYRTTKNKTHMQSFIINKEDCGPMILDALIYIKDNSPDKGIIIEDRSNPENN